ncbi:hypothetical protein SAMN05421879_1293 [Ornithinimicrobium cerasi]|uniref:Uncharacterized protein n=1 Tax=Ornithinimicrobium cerasi TaxID=2248773 RepID=A0A285VXJ5_9MICO|nr:hypothetical protein SAMN05421879_1293 [Ornithinimicrobium cerasi]
MSRTRRSPTIPANTTQPRDSAIPRLTLTASGPPPHALAPCPASSSSAPATSAALPHRAGAAGGAGPGLRAGGGLGELGGDDGDGGQPDRRVVGGDAARDGGRPRGFRGSAPHRAAAARHRAGCHRDPRAPGGRGADTPQGPAHRLHPCARSATSPYRRSDETYTLVREQLEPALEQHPGRAPPPVTPQCDVHRPCPSRTPWPSAVLGTTTSSCSPTCDRGPVRGNRPGVQRRQRHWRPHRHRPCGVAPAAHPRWSPRRSTTATSSPPVTEVSRDALAVVDDDLDAFLPPDSGTIRLSAQPAPGWPGPLLDQETGLVDTAFEAALADRSTESPRKRRAGAHHDKAPADPVHALSMRSPPRCGTAGADAWP